MSFKSAFSSHLRNLFPSRRVVFRSACLVVAGALVFFTLSLANSAVRSFYGGVAYRGVVQPVLKLVEARKAAKKKAVRQAVRQKLRQAGSLSSPYVEVGEDEVFPLLVRVWVNVDVSHRARVTNNDERFPLVYERAVSAEGFVPVVGLTFGDNSFDVELRDREGKEVARHRLSARIEDKEEAQSGISVKKKSLQNDFVSTALTWDGKKIKDSKRKISYYGVIDDFGDIRWLHRRERGWLVFGVPFGRKIFLTYDSDKIFATDVFGNRERIFDGKNASSERGNYYIHHDYTFTDKGTMLMVANPKTKKGSFPSLDDIIVEVDSNSGKVMREIDLKESLGDIFDVEAGSKMKDHALLPSRKGDWMHLNSVYYDAASDTIVLSGRNQSAVFALDYETAELTWMFANPEGLTKQQRAQFLEAPEGYVFHKAQHDAQIQGNRLRLFDNAALVQNDDGSYTDPEVVSSRIVEARLDLANNRIVSVETYVPKAIFSKVTSGYDFRDSKYLVCYCGIMKDVFGSYISDPRHKNNSLKTAELFEFEQHSDRELLHFSIRGHSFRPRYFDWKKMVGAE